MRAIGFISLLLTACTDGGGLLGDDIGSLLDPGDRVNLEADVGATPGVGDADLFDGTCMPTDTPISDPPLVATGGVNQLSVVHQGITSSDAPGWVVYGDVLDGNVIQMTYEESNPGDPTCSWEMRYTIGNLAAGTWTIRARGDEATATVTTP